MARMKVQMVRFGARQWAIVKYVAGAEEISAGQYVRDSTYANALWCLAREGERQGMPELAERLRELQPLAESVFEALTGMELPSEEDEDGDEQEDAEALARRDGNGP